MTAIDPAALALLDWSDPVLLHAAADSCLEGGEPGRAAAFRSLAAGRAAIVYDDRTAPAMDVGPWYDLLVPHTASLPAAEGDVSGPQCNDAYPGVYRVPSRRWARQEMTDGQHPYWDRLCRYAGWWRISAYSAEEAVGILEDILGEGVNPP